MARNFISEDDIEQALLQKLQHLHGFDVLDCHTANPDDLNDGSQRRDKRDVILAERLREACERLNPYIPASVITEVVATLMDRRIALSRSTPIRNSISLSAMAYPSLLKMPRA